MRSHPFRLVLAAAALLALAGCSSGGAPAEDADGASAEGAFPVTVATEFGDVVVDERPERVVALGWGDAETALALGVQPVGASDWLSFGGEGVGPWAEGLYDQAPEIIDYQELSYEAVAALEPDLILDVRGSGEQERYDRLSTIATTIGVPAGSGSFLTTTEDQVQLIAAALGEPERGQGLVDELDEAFEQVRDAHPSWQGMTVTAATKSSSGWGAYSAGNARVGFMERLGFEFSPTIAALPDGSTGRSVQIAPEQLDLLDADLIVAFPIWIDAAEMTDDPLWQRIPAVEDGRAVLLDGDLQSAYSLGSVLAVPHALERFAPLLEESLG